MKKTQRAYYFPRRLLSWLLYRQNLLMVICGASLCGVMYIFIESQLHLSEESIRFAQSVIVLFCVLFLSCHFLVSGLVGYRLVQPLGRLVEKTRRLRKFPFESDEFSDEELSYDEPGEWFDLERALNKLGRDFRRKTIRLSREKTELRTIMASVSDAVIAVDPHGKPLFYNNEMGLLFGLGELDKNILSLSEIVRSPELTDAFKKVFEKGHGRVIEIQVPLREGNVVDFSVSLAPLKRKNDNLIYGAVGVFHNITDLKGVNQMKSELVTNVSHELRTPLTAIKGYASTLMEDNKKQVYDSNMEFLSIIDKNCQRLIDLTSNLLDLSNLESPGALHTETIHTKEVTQYVLEQLPLDGRIIPVDYSAEFLKGDFLRVGQVLRNLLQNALKYVPKEKDIQVFWDETQSGEVLLRVKDNGPGIASKHQDKLFERFYRMDDSRSSDSGGRGIGLSIVKHIMQKHGGYVTLESELGEGSEFICHFPSQ